MSTFPLATTLIFETLTTLNQGQKKKSRKSGLPLYRAIFFTGKSITIRLKDVRDKPRKMHKQGDTVLLVQIHIILEYKPNETDYTPRNTEPRLRERRWRAKQR